MYSVKWIETLSHPKRKNKEFKKTFWAKKDGKIASFKKRQQARQWIRNHHVHCREYFIVHEDGTEESYLHTLQTQADFENEWWKNYWKEV